MSHAIDPMSPPVDYNGHSRIDSDQASIDTTNTHTRRSASAFGAAGGYRHIVNRRNSNDTLHRITPKRDSSESFQGVPMDDTMSIGSRRNSGQADGLLSPTHFQFPDRGLSRSTSAMQVLDIKDQVKDLKGKVSALREQARADSLKRQSLQSLRTPSPFTYAVVDQWYAEPKTTSGTEKSEGIVQDETTIQTGDENHSNEPQTPAGTSSQNHAWSGEVLISSDEEMSPVELEHGSICGNDVNDADSTTSSKYEDAERSMTPVNRSVTPPGGPDSHMFQEIIKHRLQNEIDDDMRTEDGYEDATAITDYDSDSGDSMYHDAPLPLSHEDREDAFDYEHFFLHSAMGTIRQQRLERERRGSFSSEDSVETTRGPMHTQTINRRNSADSISTMASFETADEGRHSRLTRNNSSDSASGSGGGSGIAGAPRSNSTSAKNRPGHASHMSLDTFVSAQEAHDRSSPTKTRRGVSSFRTNAGSDIPRSVSAMSSSNPALRGPMIRRPVSTSTFRHRPSTSSFDSTGTNRSFPLVSKKRLSLTLPSATSNRGPYAGIPTPGDSPNTEGEEDRDDLSDIREQLTSDATSTAARQGLPGQNGTYTPPRINDSQMSTTASMAMLQRDDQMLVEQLVASLGQCVLKLSEVDRTSTDSRVLRQRMAAARRLLEGLDEPHASWEPTSLV